MTHKIELKAVGIGIAISIVGSIVVTIFVIFWAGFLAADSGAPGLQMDAVFSNRAIGIAVLVIDGLLGLIAGFVAGRLASDRLIFQGAVVGVITVVVGLIPFAAAAPPWRILVSDSIVSFVSPIFGAKFVDWQRRRHAPANAAA